MIYWWTIKSIVIINKYASHNVQHAYYWTVTHISNQATSTRNDAVNPADNIHADTTYHSDIERLWHHSDEHVKEQYSGGNVVQSEQDLPKAFDIAQINLEDR